MAKFATGKYLIKNPEKYIGGHPPIYRSSWEFSVMAFCDNNPSIINWASEPMRIPYRNPVTGKNTVYVPDFLWVYVDKGQKRHVEIVEVKPSKQANLTEAKSYRDQLSVAINLAKWAMADQFCRNKGMKFRVLTEFDIYKNLKR